MTSRLSLLTAPAAAALSLLAVLAPPAGASSNRPLRDHQRKDSHHPLRHHHRRDSQPVRAPRHRLRTSESFRGPRPRITPVQVTGDQPGWELIPLTLPAPSYEVRTQAQLNAALQSAKPGQVIHLASGAAFSGIFDDQARAGWVTISGAGDAIAPQIAGAELEGSQYLRFTNVEFTSRVFIGRSPTRGTAQPAANVQILNSEINCGSTQTGGIGGVSKTTGVVVRQASQNVTIAGDYVHACTLGLTTVAQDNPVQNLVISHDLFSNFYGDAIDLGGADNTTVAENVIQDIWHTPGVIYHDDGIQFMGNTSNTAIQDNVLANSGDQLIFIQDAVAGQFNGVQTNSNILVDHNLVYGAGASAVQDQGAVNLRFVDNTVWDSHDAALVVRKSPYTGTSAATSVIQGNILESYIQMTQPEVESDNLITWPVPHKTYGTGDLLGVTPQFVNAAAGDFALASGSPGSGTATAATPTSTTAATATATSQTAAMTLGATPANVAYGAPLFGTQGS